MTETDPTGQQPLRWYQGVSRYAWLVLVIAALGWMFDTFDQHLFSLTRAVSVKDILRDEVPADQLDTVARIVGGQLTAVFLLGWAAGGFIFGILGDRIGRTRTMMITILIYALFTGLNGLVQTPMQYAFCRFMVALGVGGEFAAGASLVAEVWPNRSRPMALGVLQSLSAVGNICAALVSLVLSATSWRWVFAVGALPALLVVWIRRSLKEPEKWQQAREVAQREGGNRELGRMSDLFREPTLRRHTIAGVLLATAGVGGAWGIGFFSPDLVTDAFRPLVSRAPEVLALPEAQQAAEITRRVNVYKSVGFLLQMIGAGLGMFACALLCERIGRRPAMAIVFVGAFFSVQATFRFLHDPVSAYLLLFQLGFLTLPPFAAYAIYFPELFPTRLRATGVGICYNAARLLAAFAPYTLGRLAAAFDVPGDPSAGLRTAASIVACVYAIGLVGLIVAPETRGRPLPE
ncbi:MAG TPA: MFS transporter [Chthonomonadales bacterium]|nr:MFS transporter [Chthonomonadales bacterium]